MATFYSILETPVPVCSRSATVTSGPNIYNMKEVKTRKQRELAFGLKPKLNTLNLDIHTFLSIVNDFGERNQFLVLDFQTNMAILVRISHKCKR